MRRKGSGQRVAGGLQHQDPHRAPAARLEESRPGLRESLSLTARAETRDVAELEALAPELTRAAARLSELLEATVYA